MTVNISQHERRETQSQYVLIVHQSLERYESKDSKAGTAESRHVREQLDCDPFPPADCSSLGSAEFSGIGRSR